MSLWVSRFVDRKQAQLVLGSWQVQVQTGISHKVVRDVLEVASTSVGSWLYLLEVLHIFPFVTVSFQDELVGYRVGAMSWVAMELMDQREVNMEYSHDKIFHSEDVLTSRWIYRWIPARGYFEVPSIRRLWNPWFCEKFFPQRQNDRPSVSRDENKNPVKETSNSKPIKKHVEAECAEDLGDINGLRLRCFLMKRWR